MRGIPHLFLSLKKREAMIMAVSVLASSPAFSFRLNLKAHSQYTPTEPKTVKIMYGNPLLNWYHYLLIRVLLVLTII